MSESNDRGNLSLCPVCKRPSGGCCTVMVRDSDTGAGLIAPGSRPENPQDLTLSLPRDCWFEVEMALAGYDAGTPRRAAIAQRAFETIGRMMSDSSPDQGEHVAQRKEGTACPTCHAELCAKCHKPGSAVWDGGVMICSECGVAL